MKQCNSCGKTYDDPTAIFCENCGNKLLEKELKPVPDPFYQKPAATVGASVNSTPPQYSLKCKNCGHVALPSEEWCSECGLRLEKVALAPNQPTIISGNPSLELLFSDSANMTINQFPMILGRKDVLRYRSYDAVSTKHVAFYYENGQFLIEDQNSLNGTSLNGRIIGSGRKSEGKIPIKNGDYVQIVVGEKGEGEIKFTIRIG
jgi:DNA-directed RNA polymerase subunit RPC12/RpoP